MRPVLLTILMVLAISCTDSGTEPEPMSHEFVWEIDTILPNAFQFIGLTFWGTSDSNVYIGGHDADGGQSLLRYDGSEWKIINLFQIGFNTIQEIDGTDSSLFAIAGQSKWSQVAIYNHGAWDTLPIPRLHNDVQRMDFVSSSEIYLAVIDGLLKYDGNSFNWIIDSSQVEYDQSSGRAFYPGCVVKGQEGIVYFTTARHRIGEAPVFRLFMYDGAKSSIIEEAENAFTRSSTQKGGMNIATVGADLVSGFNAIYLIENGNLNKLYDVRGDIFAGTDIYKNLFAFSNQMLMHYNGEDWKDIAPPILKNNSQKFWFQTMYYVGRTLFIAGTLDGYHTLVIRGKHVN